MAEERAFLLKISLRGVSKPPVWRRIRVPGQIKFSRLHQVLQVVMGWENCHLHQFSTRYRLDYIFPDKKLGKVGHDGRINDSRTLTSVALAPGAELVYGYDFGDDWRHDIKVEAISQSSSPSIICLEGKGRCPPEDCGGPGGYEMFKEAVEDPTHEDHGQMMEWIWDAFGLEDFDPSQFDAESVNCLLKRARLNEI